MNAPNTRNGGREELNEPGTGAAEPAACGPGCDCGSPSGGGRAKLVISVVVLLAAAGIVGYKVADGSLQDAGDAVAGQKEAEGFTIAAPAQSGARETGASPRDRGNPDGAALSTGDTGRIGKCLGSLGELNKVASSQDAVFVFIPAKEGESASDTTRAAVLSARNTLASSNIKVGLYTLNTTSGDYASISSQGEVPAILVLCKGGKMGRVSGNVTETRLLQAFTAASRVGGCGPGGCGPSGCR